MLKKYIDVILRIGLNIQPGDRLHIRSEASDWELVRKFSAAAYELGASFVSIEWEDSGTEALSLINGDEEQACTWPAWKKTITEDLLESNACVLVLEKPFAAGLDGEIPVDRLMKRQRSKAMACEAFNTRVLNFDLRYCIAEVPNEAWAKKVFPDLSTEEALKKLWDAVFFCSYAHKEDPVAFWRKKQEEAKNRYAYLVEKQFDAVRFRDSFTDLCVELPKNHFWLEGGVSCRRDGVYFLPNIPSEECASVPFRTGVNGRVRLTKPLVYQDIVIEGAVLRFDKGRVVEYSAERGEEGLAAIINADENSCYLGEVALVPEKSSIGSTGLIFYSTLYDENASCHIALGEGFPDQVEGLADKTRQEQIALGLNRSTVHVDMMIGNDEMAIYGIKDGEETLLISGGEWKI